MSQLRWQVGSGLELSQLLGQSTVQESAALGSTTVYRVNHAQQEKIAVALPDGQVLFIEAEALGRPRRRRVEPVAPEPSQ